jgi:quinohemoprotein ethanol dehydrogenase
MIKRFMLGLAIAAAAVSSLCHAMGGTAPAADQAKQVDRGAKLYNQSCYKCHGPQAVSGGTIPDLRMFEGSQTEFVSIVMSGRSGTIMPAWKEFLSEDEVTSIYAYVRSRPR